MKAAFVRVLAATLATVLPFVSPGGTNDVDRTDPNFVTASLMITGPGEALFSCVGHSCLRMRCPKFDLDNCFSYESEDVLDRIFMFFMGRLKMGMFTIPTRVYLENHEQVERGVEEYRLNLPADVKQRLWKVLDDQAAVGFVLPYDYVERGCAHAILGFLLKSVDPVRVGFPKWTDKYSQTRREIVAAEVRNDYPWNMFFLHAIWGTDTDLEVSKVNKVVTPKGLIEFLSLATIDGVPIIDHKSVVIQKPTVNPLPTLPFSPISCSVVLLLAAIAFLIAKRKGDQWVFLPLLACCGLFFTYLVFFSGLPATSWNWLIVPFNLLPIVLWRWRRFWAHGFAVILLVWEAFMILAPHQLTDPAYLVIVLAYVIFYVKVARTP